MRNTHNINTPVSWFNHQHRRAVQPRKAVVSILDTDVGMATIANELHAANAQWPMLLTDVGIATIVNELHPQKALAPMLVSDVGMSMLVNELHSVKVQPSMLVTLIHER